MGKILFFIFSSVLVFAITIFYRLGGHREVLLREEVRPALYMLYVDHKGPYHKINEAIVRVEAVAAQNSIPCLQTFGEYLDDPRSMEDRHLRSRGGCLMTTPLEEVPEGFLAREISARKWLVGHFEGAPSIGPFKVYPKATDWFHSRQIQMPIEAIEIYTIKGSNQAHTEYLFALPDSEGL